MTLTNNDKMTVGREQTNDPAWERFYEQGLKVFIDRLAARRISYLPKFAVVTPQGFALRERLAECGRAHDIAFGALDCSQPLTRRRIMQFYEDLSASPGGIVLLDHLAAIRGQDDDPLLARLLIHAWKNPAIDLDNGASLQTEPYLVLFAVDAGTEPSMEGLWDPGDGFGWYGDLLKP